jgi:hypothetical protein
MKTKPVFWLLLVACFTGLAALAAEAPPISARVVGFRQEGDGRIRFFFEIANRTPRHLFVFGFWHQNANSFDDIDSGFEVPPVSVQLSALSGSISVVQVSSSSPVASTSYSTEPLGSDSTYHLLLHGTRVAPGDKLPSGQSRFVDVAVSARLLGDEQVAGERKLALVFNVPVFALNEDGTEFAKVLEFATPPVSVRVDAQDRVTVVDPAAPNKDAKHQDSIDLLKP